MRYIDKPGSRKRFVPQEAPKTFAHCLAAFQDEETRSQFLSFLRAKKFKADDFAHGRHARVVCAEAMTRTEDWHEQEYKASSGRVAERAAMRAMRRRLEWELWP